MIDTESFKEWLASNTSYSDRVVRDIVSRMKRADGILPWMDEDVYQFRLERSKPYAALSTSVRSQCKRAVTLYFEYAHRNG